MMKKCFVLIVTLMIITTSNITFLRDFEVKATSGGSGEGEWTNETSLEYDWTWEVIEDYAGVVHDDTLWDNTNWIRKGRAFGTPGDNWTAYDIQTKLENMDFDNVILDQIGTVQSNDDLSILPWNCNYKFEAINFKLEINNDEEVYPWTNPIPKNETFVIPSAYRNLSHNS